MTSAFGGLPVPPAMSVHREDGPLTDEPRRGNDNVRRLEIEHAYVVVRAEEPPRRLRRISGHDGKLVITGQRVRNVGHAVVLQDGGRNQPAAVAKGDARRDGNRRERRAANWMWTF